MYRMSILTMIPPAALRSRLNIPHCTQMALIHDMAELLVGDITPIDGVEKPEKHRREQTTMDYLTKQLLGNVAGGSAGEEILAIFEEYEEGKTMDAVYVKDIDKMELLLQAVEYERSAVRKFEMSLESPFINAEPKELDLGEFMWVAEKITLPEMKVWAAEILKERESFWNARGKKIGVDVSGGRGKDDRSLKTKEGVEDYYKEEEVGLPTSK
jgi:putative hydrolases of HD superfamily